MQTWVIAHSGGFAEARGHTARQALGASYLPNGSGDAQALIRADLLIWPESSHLAFIGLAGEQMKLREDGEEGSLELFGKLWHQIMDRDRETYGKSARQSEGCCENA